jgi:hypothetical protein
MSTKAVAISCVLFIVYACLQVPTVLGQQASRRNANLIELGLSAAGVTACAIFVAIRNAKAGS